MLVDFDGVSQDGKDQYSACLNRAAGLGMDKLQIMEKSHDLDNLERLMAGFSGEHDIRFCLYCSKYGM